MKWPMRNGEQIEVSDMETSHIQNALAMLEKKGFIGPSDVEFYLFCPGPHGDFAQMAFEHEIEMIFDAPVSRFVDIFKDELKRRELK
jgi:hypothetical protein